MRFTKVLAAAAITETCAHEVGHSSTVQAASVLIVMRARSVQRLRAMPHIACATTATATTFRPCRTPTGSAVPQLEMPTANAISTRAEGRVKPSQAASTPPNPARASPIAMPT